MYVIIGLGNPGPQYAGTRHNAGFALLDELAGNSGIDISRNKFKSLVGEGFLEGRKVLLMKPQTFMNLSGEAVVQALNFYKPNQDELIVVYDDIALPPGAVRVRDKGSAGGHNGMKSIIALTGTEDFIRLRIGVGGARGSLVSHVLGKFSAEEQAEYAKGLALAGEALRTILKGGVEEAMNRFNSSGKPPKKPRLPKSQGAAEEGVSEATIPSNAAAHAIGASPEALPGGRPDPEGQEAIQPEAKGGAADQPKPKGGAVIQPEADGGAADQANLEGGAAIPANPGAEREQRS